MPVLFIVIFFVTSRSPPLLYFFFFNDTATTEIYTLSLHDALPISTDEFWTAAPADWTARKAWRGENDPGPRDLTDRKSTRLNSSHLVISYAVFCLKKKKNHTNDQ